MRLPLIIMFLAVFASTVLSLDITSLVKSNNVVTLTWDEKMDVYQVLEASSPTGVWKSATSSLERTNQASFAATNAVRFYLVLKHSF